MRETAIALSLVLAACGGEGPSVDDRLEPVLTVESPARGTTVSADFVEVVGTISDADSGIDKVTVNGVPAELDSTGRFSARVPLEGGVTILETVGIDAAGNQASDHRGVLAGQLAPLGTNIRDAFIAELTPATFSVIGEIAANAASRIDFVAVGNAISPIIDRGNSCFGVEVDLRDVQFSALDIALAPANAALEITLTATDLDVDMRANWEISCFGGGAGLNISADQLVVSGKLNVALVSGRFVASLENATASFVGFDLDVGSIPDSIVDLFVNDIDQKVGNALIGAIRGVVPDVVESSLDGFADAELSPTLFGIEMTMDLSPTSVEISPTGGRIALDFSANADGLEGATYVATPQAAPSAEQMSGESLGLAVADDVANQLLAILWHGGALSADIAVAGTPLGEIFPTAERVTVALLLPPVITTTDSELAAIGIGDMIITALDSGGVAVAELALSGHVEVGVSVVGEGTAALGATITDLSTTVLSGQDALGLRADQLVIFADVGVSQIRTKLNEVLNNLTIPQFGAGIRAPTLGATRGYLLVSGQLAAE